jgi:ring-1,2-phenylacetyl-CoA epoxidase subunit PaaC
MDSEKFIWLLRNGDNALVLSQRLSEWCGKGPALEEDMALTNTALDLLGQATLWLSYAGEHEGAGRDEDQLAFLRDAPQFRNVLLVEQPNHDYADTLMRQFYFDVWHYEWLQALSASSDERVASIAAKSVSEVRYHLRRSTDLLVRLGDGSVESHRRMQVAADQWWSYTGELFSSDDIDRSMAERAIAPLPETLHAKCMSYFKQSFDAATLIMPPVDAWMHGGGKQGRHSEHLGYMLAEMQFLQRAYPGAQW